MKKILCTLIILCMALSSCIFLASCDNVKENDMKKTPAKTVATAFDNTCSTFFEDGVGIYDVINGASKSSLELYFESDLLGEDISRLDAKIYADQKNNKYVIDAGADYDGEHLSGTIFVDKSGITATGESIFGSNKSYGLYYDTFIKNFEDSSLAEMLGVTNETSEKLVELVSKVKETMNNSSSENIDNVYNLGDDICELLGQTVTTEDVDVNGKDTECLVVSYTIDNDTIERVVQHIYKEQLKESDTDRTIEDSLDDAINSLNNTANIDITLEVVLVKKTGNLAKVTIDGTISEVNKHDEAEKATIRGEINFSDTAIEIEFDIRADGEKYSFDATIEKEVNKDNVTYLISARVGANSAYMDIIDAELVFENNGDFEINAEIMTDEDSTAKFRLTGSYKVEKKKVTLEFTSVKIDNKTLEFKLGVIIDTNPDIPSTPKNPEDLIDFTDSDWEELFNSIENSDFGYMIKNIAK